MIVISTVILLLIYVAVSVAAGLLYSGALVLSGSGLNPVGPARATAVTLIDPHTAVFTLSKGFSNQGTVTARIAAGAVKSTSGASLAGFTDSFKILAALVA